jgi:hypothetical protein
VLYVKSRETIQPPLLAQACWSTSRSAGIKQKCVLPLF